MVYKQYPAAGKEQWMLLLKKGNNVAGVFLISMKKRK